MKNAFVLAYLILAFHLAGPAEAQTAKPLSVAPEQVQRVEILYFPERILVRAALTPERLEKHYQYKLEIRNVHESAEWEHLRSVLHETSVTLSGDSYDHRTAVLLFRPKRTPHRLRVFRQVWRRRHNERRFGCYNGRPVSVGQVIVEGYC